MSNPTPRQFSVFYSWQTDSPSSTNRDFIRVALRDASTQVEAAFQQVGLSIQTDEATRDLPGSPPISESIRKKIEASDAFLCDLTTINPGAVAPVRRVPNPNVMFELGYAVARLGWDRIIMVFNEAVGRMDDEVPFDVKGHRITKYNFPAPRGGAKEIHAKTTNVRSQFKNTLADSISGIISKDPIRADAAWAGDPRAMRRNNDVNRLRMMFDVLHLPTFDEHLREMPRVVTDEALYVWERLREIVENSLFHLYDPTLAETTREILESWTLMLAPDVHYYPVGRGRYVFSNPMDMPLDRRQQQDWDAIVDARNRLASAMSALLRQVRAEYLEVDIDAGSANAWHDWVESERRAEERMRKLT